MITQSELKSILNYNEFTGIFTYKIPRKNCKVGNIAGCINGKGYINIRINNKIYQGHRLAWLYVHGYLPKYIDHINRIKDDNRISNLRPATAQQNAFNTKLYSNNQSGVKGIYWNKSHNQWKIHIRLNGKKIHLGYSKDFFEACCTSISARNKYCGEFV